MVRGSSIVDQRSVGDVHGTTLLVASVSLAVILGLRLKSPKVPGALVLVACGLAASALFDLGAHGVALVGDVPRGLPAPARRRSVCCGCPVASSPFSGTN